MHPRIAATTYREVARWGVWELPADLLPVAYTQEIEAAGGIPVLFPPLAPELAAGALDGVHGLLLAGGADVAPEQYGAPRDVHTGPARTDRDGWELALLHAALARDLPVLAVCRGMQVLNVALGGDLIQHLPDEVGSDLHCPLVGEHGRHPVEVAAGSVLAGIVGARQDIATYHHQAVRRLGTGLTATAWAADGVVEAVELGNRSWVHGVQWHPEAHEGHALFTAFVDACRAHREVGAERGQ
ncbi:MAG: putative glutamine amidotransferase [Pseudonocardiales bacterium]|nr:putative glutamine amidotransferase [Pseudonocardiales bacterium]